MRTLSKAQRQVVAEKIGSTVRVLELLGLSYEVGPPKNTREKGNASPRVINVHVDGKHRFRIYNSVSGSTWAYEANGTPLRIGTIEELYEYLRDETAARKPKRR